LFFRLLAKHLLPQARAVDFLVALGTHPALSEEAMLDLFGLSPEERARHANVRFLNHAWDDPRTLAEVGTIPADEVRALSGGRLRMQVPVRLNRMVLE